MGMTIFNCVRKSEVVDWQSMLDRIFILVEHSILDMLDLRGAAVDVLGMWVSDSVEH